jgi:hypothetical protein
MKEKNESLITIHDKKNNTVTQFSENNKDEKGFFELVPLGSWFGKYIELINTPIKTVFDGLKSFSKDQKDISEKVLSTIDKSVDVLEKELDKDLPPQERKEVRERVSHLIQEARQESTESRLFGEGLALLGGSIALAAVGLGIMAYDTHRAKKELLDYDEDFEDQ